MTSNRNRYGLTITDIVGEPEVRASCFFLCDPKQTINEIVVLALDEYAESQPTDISGTAVVVGITAHCKGALIGFGSDCQMESLCSVVSQENPGPSQSQVDHA